jgi:Protein of unknown function (DUF1588)
MRHGKLQKSATCLAAAGMSALLGACSTTGSGDPGSLMAASGANGQVVEQPSAGKSSKTVSSVNVDNPGAGGTPVGTTKATTATSGSDPHAATNPNIVARKINYGEALRTATLKLVGDLPAMQDITDIATAATASDGGKSVYEGKITALLADPRFAVRQIQWWRDTFKTGEAGQATGKGVPSFDTAATFAAYLTVNSLPYTQLFTATTGTCPTFANGTFTPANCTNNAPTAGILTDPGLMAQYFADMAIRRVRFIQETFVCNKFPTEFSDTPSPMGAGIYTSPWAFDSIAGGATARVNFQDTSAIVCADCHSTINHMAPLFSYFDMNGNYTAGTIQVTTPSIGNPTSELADWLPAGQPYAWRDGTNVTDIPGLGAAMAADPDVATCAVNRVWNYAMSRGDIVNDLATVPTVVTAPLVKTFQTGGMKLLPIIQAVFTSDDFVQF